MRVALLTMTEAAGTPGEVIRAHLKVGAMTLARHQLALVLVLGCQRVVCLAPAFDAEMMALQHVCERARASFHVISGARGLQPLVTAADDLVALGDGLLAWPAMAAELLETGPAVLVQPIERGLVEGFERVDLNHAAAAAFRVPGSLVERLSDLPPDCDPFAALQRIALQAGVPLLDLPLEAAETGRWALVRSEAEAHAVEAAWIRLHTGNGAGSPSLALARRLVRMLGPALLHAGSGGTVVAIAALVLALLGLVAGRFGFSGTGFTFCACGWVLALAAATLGRVEREALGEPDPAYDRAEAFGWAMDGVLALLMAWSVALAPGQGWVQRGFGPVMLLGLARILPALRGPAWARWLGDRALLARVLALASLFDLIGEVVGLLALVLLVLGVISARRPE